jgi:hypothetical protein
MGVEAGLTLDQFWRLTPYGLHIHLEAYARRIKKQYELAAWQSCIIANVWLPRGKKLRPSRLLPQRKRVIDVSTFNSKEELDAYLEKVREEEQE